MPRSPPQDPRVDRQRDKENQTILGSAWSTFHNKHALSPMPGHVRATMRVLHAGICVGIRNMALQFTGVAISTDIAVAHDTPCGIFLVRRGEEGMEDTRPPGCGSLRWAFRPGRRRRPTA